MSPNLESLARLIRDSNLGEGAKEELIMLFGCLNQKDIDNVVEVFSEMPELIEKIYQNYQAKKAALVKKDRSAWEDILKEEFMYLLKYYQVEKE